MRIKVLSLVSHTIIKFLIFNNRLNKKTVSKHVFIVGPRAEVWGSSVKSNYNWIKSRWLRTKIKWIANYGQPTNFTTRPAATTPLFYPSPTVSSRSTGPHQSCQSSSQTWGRTRLATRDTRPRFAGTSRSERVVSTVTRWDIFFSKKVNL
jgi:hypothetical protein